MKQWFSQLFYTAGCAFELARGVIIFAVVLTLVTIFIATINVVKGASMEPNFHDAQFLIIDRLSYQLRDPRRGEVVVLKFPGDPEKTRYIKRVIGLPGETIEISNSQVFINGRLIHELYIPEITQTLPNLKKKLGDKEYYLMGDNRENSNDSRAFGAVERRFIIGLAYVIIWPLSDAGLVPPQIYSFAKE